MQARADLICREEELAQTLLAQLIDEQSNLAAHVVAKRADAGNAFFSKLDLSDPRIALAPASRNQALRLQGAM